MLKLKDSVNPKDLGFKTKDFDYVRYIDVDGVQKVCFTIYKGSPYIRYSKTAYVAEEQLKLVYEWSKNNYIEWEDL